MRSDLSARVVPFVEHVLEAMGLSLRVVSEPTTDGLRLDIDGEGGEILLRRKGEALDALQHLVNAAFRRDLSDGERIALDYLGFRRGKDAELRQMALFLVERARASGLPQEIGPLNPYARRIVHLAVAESPDMASESVGDAFMKIVVISVRAQPKR